MNSASSPEQAADCSAPCSSDGSSQLPLSGMPTASESSVRGAATWPTPQAQMPGAGPDNSKVQNLLTGSRHSLYLTHAIEAERQSPGLFSSPSTPTSAPSTRHPAPATSSPEAFPASRSVRPGSGSVRMTRATCGHTPFAYWSSQERRWDSSRTCLDFSAADTSEPFSETWPKWGSMRSGACWEQTMSVPRIGGSGCGYWPSSAGSYQTPSVEDASRQGSAEGWREWDLATAIARGASTPQTWPTVTAQDAKNDGGPSQSERNTVPLNAAVKQWQTPSKACADGGQTSRGGSRKNELLLTGQVRAYATPRAEDSQCAGRRHNRETSDTLYAQTVTDTNSNLGSLNPTWVEWLQGFPRGWTDCEHSETPKSLNAWRQRSRTWLRALGYPLPGRCAGMEE